MDWSELLIKYWPIWSAIGFGIGSLVAWNIKTDRRVTLIENNCNIYKELTAKREGQVDKAINDLFSLLRKVEKVVNIMYGAMKEKSKDGK